MLSAASCCAALVAVLPVGQAFAATPDSAAPKVVGGSVADGVYVLKPTGTRSVVVFVHATDARGVTAVRAHLLAPGKSKPAFDIPLTRVSGTAKDGVWRGSVAVGIGNIAGGWTMKGYASDAAGNRSGSSSVLDRFSLKRHVYLSSWQAEPTNKTSFRFAASLAVAKKGGYESLPAQIVSLDFRPKGSSTWKKKHEVTSTDGGIYYGTRTNTTDGYWRMRFPGSGTLTKAVTRAIFVDMP